MPPKKQPALRKSIAAAAARRVSADAVFFCIYCQEEFGDDTEMQAHVQETHNALLPVASAAAAAAAVADVTYSAAASSSARGWTCSVCSQPTPFDKATCSSVEGCGGARPKAEKKVKAKKLYPAMQLAAKLNAAPEAIASTAAAAAAAAAPTANRAARRLEYQAKVAAESAEEQAARAAADEDRRLLRAAQAADKEKQRLKQQADEASEFARIRGQRSTEERDGLSGAALDAYVAAEAVQRAKRIAAEAEQEVKRQLLCPLVQAQRRALAGGDIVRPMSELAATVTGMLSRCNDSLFSKGKQLTKEIVQSVVPKEIARIYKVLASFRALDFSNGKWRDLPLYSDVRFAPLRMLLSRLIALSIHFDIAGKPFACPLCLFPVVSSVDECLKNSHIVPNFLLKLWMKRAGVRLHFMG